MNVFKSIARDFVNFFNIKTRSGLIRTIIGVILLIVLVQFLLNRTVETAETPALPPTVLVTTAAAVTNNDGFSLIGSVEAKNQARIQTEAGGRVTSVPVALGQQLTAGTIIAQLENASQYAALLQAEGSYEAALAAAAQSDVSAADAQNALQTAQNNAVNTYRNAYTTVNNAVISDLDTFYSNPQSSNFGVRIDSKGQANTLVETRKQLNGLLSEWQSDTQTITTNDDLTVSLDEARARTNQVISLVDTFINLTTTADVNETLDGQLVRSYTENLVTLRSTLNGTLNQLANAETSVSSAEDALRRAQIGGSNPGEVSAADAQVKQALGTLRAAQATYNKTIIRTPIAGTLNELAVKTGDYVSVGAPVALVANNNALEITMFVGERDAARMEVGQTVRIEGSIDGVVTAIAPGVDSVTKKTEVKIGTESEALQTGDTVTITFTTTESSDTSVAGPILIPITAVKFTATDGSIFVIEENKLVSRPVTIGPITGSLVTIEDGLDRTTEFVVDARGLTEGSEVEAISN